ncbi:bifunctional 5,10-methylenetetrahydrofolate dehydrogenase/5,10-methenyltetrahydrofolate cyclohydrolase [Pontibacter burrus]|uniref:Bifunctional protein FolD n=1 Tax=Pontibacter burrus TaxID=2704466 RepID=A0A6B3LM83_9BACT|nr:tetrahydrofolate dehydrogenase/cyclohydrolase catalytic domain-containing protein [Pontibacter burrus]NEM97849.1 bifunctional 5,10-methylene-tetrahydrofolate dehydrogenase/5,10-methylene-tetrahydrofolate cyclohydrolase [Pontibacter burrus]
MILLDGKRTSEAIQQEIAAEVDAIRENGGKVPHLAAVLVGNDGGSVTYVTNKVLACERVGFGSSLIRYNDDVTEDELLAKIQELNESEEVDGFIVQLPLPRHINAQKVLEAIDPRKDVDGFHPINVGRMVVNLPSYLPATPYGILQLLERYNIETAGKHCVVIGRSNIVGTPMSILMAKGGYPGNATVTLCHRNTIDLGYHTRQADIIIVAVGQPGLLTADMVKEGAVVIDVGTTRVPDASRKSGYRLRGDVDFGNVAPKCSFITPVPGGVGPLTIAMLLKNTLKAAKREVYV